MAKSDYNEMPSAMPMPTNGQMDMGEFTKWFEQYYDASKGRTDTGWSNFWNMFNFMQQQQAYERSMPQNQVAQMMQAGMSRQGALAAVQGLDTSTSPASWSNSASADTQAITGAIDTGVNALNSLAQIGGQLYQNYVGIRQIHGDKLVEPIAEMTYSMLKKGENPPPPEAFLSPQEYKLWLRSQPENSGWHKIYQSKEWDAMMADLYGQKAFRREFMENVACRGYKELELDAQRKRASMYYATKIQQGQIKAQDLAFERGTLEYDQYQRIASLMTDKQSAQLEYELWEITQESSPTMKRLKAQNMINTAEYDAYKSYTDKMMQSNFKDLYTNSPSYQNAIAISNLLDALGVDDDGLGGILRGANTLGSGIISDELFGNAATAIGNALGKAYESLKPEVAPTGQSLGSKIKGAFTPKKAAKQIVQNEQEYLKAIYQPNQVYNDEKGAFRIGRTMTKYGETTYHRVYI